VEQTSNALIFKLNEQQKSNDILKILIQNNIEITGMAEILPSVNEIFIQAVNATP
jgi:ABC-2 type transport system ATP-binding protein